MIRTMILGIDEVGRGPWAGPLVVGAVVLGGATIDGLTDSKKLSKKRRQELDSIIRHQAKGYGLGWVWPNEIDQLGLSAALSLATIRAIEQIKTSYSEIVIDGTVNFLKQTGKGKYVTTMKQADLLVPSVSAASIIAKVARDNYMVEQAAMFPEYGFEKHVGYGTAAHKQAIEQYGVTRLHRTSFAPIKAASNLGMTTKKIGDRAEDEAANELQRLGHKIIDRNWRTKFCEIDIISESKGTLYFVEVKYRRLSGQGGGVGAITPKKLRQMKFAAEYYVLKNRVIDTDLRLAVMTLTHQPPVVESYIEIQ